MGPATLRLEPDLDREPDVFFIARAHADRVGKRCIEGAADFIIEVVSEGTRDLDLVTNREEYESHGVPLYWAVDLDRKVLVEHRLRAGRYRLEEHVSGRVKVEPVKGFWIDVAWLFRDPPPKVLDCLREIEGRGA